MQKKLLILPLLLIIFMPAAYAALAKDVPFEDFCATKSPDHATTAADFICELDIFQMYADIQTNTDYILSLVPVLADHEDRLINSTNIYTNYDDRLVTLENRLVIIEDRLVWDNSRLLYLELIHASYTPPHTSPPPTNTTSYSKCGPGTVFDADMNSCVLSNHP